MRLKIPEQLIYLLAGSLLAFIVMSLCSRKNEKVPKSIIVEPTKIETLKVFKVIPMKPETVLTQRVYHKNETVYVEPPKVINWREYVYEDKQIKLSVEADTIKKMSYKLKQKPPTRELGVIFNTQSILIYGGASKHALIGVGWNFANQSPELLVGLRLQF